MTAMQTNCQHASGGHTIWWCPWSSPVEWAQLICFTAALHF